MSRRSGMILKPFNFCPRFLHRIERWNGGQSMNRLLFRYGVATLMTALLVPQVPARAADEPDLIFKRSTVFKWLTPNDKLATYGLDDPEVEGVACHFTVPEKGGFKGWVGVAEEVSDISLACRQIGPIRIKAKFEQGEDVFRKRRSLFFKKMQIVRGCDVKRNVLVYMVFPIASSRVHRRTRPPRCRSCRGARLTRSSAAPTSSRTSWHSNGARLVIALVSLSRLRSFQLTKCPALIRRLAIATPARSQHAMLPTTSVRSSRLFVERPQRVHYLL
jgi:CreA protein